MDSSNEDHTRKWAEHGDELAPNLQGAKLKFGNTTRDPQDPRVCRPHSRVVPSANESGDYIRCGGLLQTGGHRPGAVGVAGTGPGSGHGFGALSGAAGEKSTEDTEKGKDSKGKDSKDKDSKDK